ncbi:5'-methylthioadenosine/S-adenosylhomocysteine nucleosidase [Bifidobacterium sp. ESL0745]|uniref:5'-methylthioadenosine/S-adenosylhomocysteine nucleosidase n=1 Tax=Bifidobacterium sp. ESL0745 TaxID=2983226 RepID=UPI0023F8555C|nr:5'-methylthioadenosine/S-adenosylhomocysteine nucleosidase [Bifidobacterium sp. ESL0745]MDF7665521.1 5'-methylthioadenosine/S-adenosylhomocysteine nucleosidase [Bifidobacterium sp. ESL0745]
MKTIAIIGAMEEEVALIAKSLNGVKHNKAASLDVNVGTLTSKSGEQIAVAATVGGMGLVNAAATTQFLVDGYHPDAIIFSGIAGSLNKSMHVNDVVLGGTLRYLDSDMRMIAQWKPETDEFHSDRHLLDVAEAALDELGIHHMTGIIASGNNFIGTPEAAAVVAEQTHADAVEMEGAAVAHVAARNDVPALVIRALSDEADTSYEQFHEFDISEYADTAARIAVDIVTRL